MKTFVLGLLISIVASGCTLDLTDAHWFMPF